MDFLFKWVILPLIGLAALFSAIAVWFLSLGITDKSQMFLWLAVYAGVAVLALQMVLLVWTQLDLKRSLRKPPHVR